MLRPENRPFAIRAYNAFAGAFGFGASLNFDKIIKKARSNTNLHEFGSDFNEASLRKIISTANAEAKLHPFGVMMLKEKLISQLENRLWAEYWFRKYPEILEQELLPVVLITGMQRTGTTKMQRLLSGFPEARALLSWEALYPAPLGAKDEMEKRISRTRRNEKAVRWISPTFHAIHPIHTHEPEEDVLLLDVHFMSSSLEAILNIPSYAHWLSQQDHKQAYVYETKLLKLLQWRRTGKFWVLKSPHHLEYLPIIDKVFSDLHIIWMHRPIEECMPSFFSMLYYSRSMFSGEVDKYAVLSQWTQKLTSMLHEGLNYRADNPGRIIDVSFDDFIKSESKVIESIIEQIPFISPKALKFKDKTKQRYVSNHQYNLEDWGINLKDLHNRFDFYHREVFKNSGIKYSNE